MVQNGAVEVVCIVSRNAIRLTVFWVFLSLVDAAALPKFLRSNVACLVVLPRDFGGKTVLSIAKPLLYR